MTDFIIVGCSVEPTNINRATIRSFSPSIGFTTNLQIDIIARDNNNYAISYIIPTYGVLLFEVIFDNTTSGQTIKINYVNNSGTYLSVSPNLLLNSSQICDNNINSDSYKNIDVIIKQDIGDLFQGNSFVIELGRTLTNQLVAKVTGKRIKNPNFSGNVGMPSTPINDKIRVPIILIEGQVFIDGSDLSDMKFTISDEYEYYEKCDIFNNNKYKKCGIYFTTPNELKQTTFRKCCKDISLFTVLRGKGNTALEKAEYLYLKNECFQTVDFYTFYYNNLILYSMMKYILSKIFYGKFDIKFLLGQYNDNFYKNLGNSRFCGALSIFNEFALYNKLFKYDL